MPQINLLYPAQAKKVPQKIKTWELPKVDGRELVSVLIPATLPLAAILAIISLVLFLISGSKTTELSKLRIINQDITVNPQEIQKINNLKSALTKKNAFLEELLSRKFLWSDKLIDLADCVPAGIWLTELSVEREQTTVRGRIEERGGFVLAVRGSAIAPHIDSAVSFVGEFVSTLKQKDSFAKDFSEIKLNSISKGTIGKSDVMNFEVVCVPR